MHVGEEISRYMEFVFLLPRRERSVIEFLDTSTTSRGRVEDSIRLSPCAVEKCYAAEKGRKGGRIWCSCLDQSQPRSHQSTDSLSLRG